MTRNRALVAPLTGLILLLGPLAAGAQASPAAPIAPADTTPPSVSLQPARYIVGSVIHGDVVVDPPNSYVDDGWSFRLHGTASDASGICAQSIFEFSDNNEGGQDTPCSTSPKARSITSGADDNDFGKEGFAIIVRVTDCAGNTTAATSRRSRAGSPRTTRRESATAANGAPPPSAASPVGPRTTRR